MNNQGRAFFISIILISSCGLLGSSCFDASLSSSHLRCAGLLTSKAGVRPQRQMARRSVSVSACGWADRGRRRFRRMRRRMRMGGMLGFCKWGDGVVLGGGGDCLGDGYEQRK